MWLNISECNLSIQFKFFQVTFIATEKFAMFFNIYGILAIKMCVILA